MNLKDIQKVNMIGGGITELHSEFLFKKGASFYGKIGW
tara:strand:+ start:13109 stop:13222 length:114 start_codon:yes stop_codon:yes gene_type:complete